jgi:hypothetical protein
MHSGNLSSANDDHAQKKKLEKRHTQGIEHPTAPLSALHSYLNSGLSGNNEGAFEIISLTERNDDVE